MGRTALYPPANWEICGRVSSILGNIGREQSSWVIPKSYALCVSPPISAANLHPNLSVLLWCPSVTCCWWWLGAVGTLITVVSPVGYLWGFFLLRYPHLDARYPFKQAKVFETGTKKQSCFVPCFKPTLFLLNVANIFTLLVYIFKHFSKLTCLRVT